MFTNSTSLPVRGIVRDASVAARLRDYLMRNTEAEAVEHFGLSRLAIARAAAGLALHASTLRSIVDGLERAETDL